MAEQAVQHEAQNMLVVKPLFYYFLRCIFHVTVVEVSILPQIARLVQCLEVLDVVGQGRLIVSC